MKKLFLTIFALFSIILSAQTVTFNPKTGDLDMDNVLKDINNEAKKDISTFKDNVNKKFSLAKNKIDDLLKIMEPGDVYMTAQTAEATNKPVDEVAKAYEANKGKGWGEVAKSMGIKPGSKEFHALKAKMKENKGKGKEKEKTKKKDKEKKKEGKKEHNSDDSDKKDNENKKDSDKKSSEEKGKGKSKGSAKTKN